MTLEAETEVRPRSTRARRAKPETVEHDLSELEERGSVARRARVVDEESPLEGMEEAVGTEGDEPPTEPEGNEPPVEDEQEEQPETEEPAPTTPLARPATPPQGKPRRTRGKRTAPEAQPVPDIQALRPASSQALKKFGTVLGNKIPGAEHVEVWKRSENGQLGYVGDYNSSDVSQSQSFASFLSKYAKPTYGAGDYQLFGITPDGKRWDAGVVRILGGVEPTDAPGPRGENSSIADNLMRMIERDSQRREREMREILDKKSEAGDPIDQLTKIHDFSQKLSGDAGKGEGAIVAMVQAMGQTTTTMLQVMTQQQQKSDERMVQLMSVLGRKEADPLMMTLLAKLLEDKTSSGPMPAMPPPVDPMVQLQGLAAVMTALKPNDNGLTATLIEQMNKDRMSTADIINLVNQLRGERGTDDFKKTSENLKGLMDFVTILKQQTEPSAGSMWGDIIGGALSNQQLVGSLAGLIRAKSQPQTRVVQSQPQQQAQPQQLPADVQAKAADLARRRLALEEQKILEEERRLGLTSGTAPVVVTPPPVAAAVTPAAPAAAQQPTQQNVNGLPPNIVEHVNKFVTAQDDGALVEATLDFLLYLSSIGEPWKGTGDTMLDAINSGDRENSLKFVHQLLTGLVKSNLMVEELKTRTFAAVEAHFDEMAGIVQKIAENNAAEDAEAEDGDDEADNEIEPPVA